MSNLFTFLTAGEGNGVVYGTHNGSEVATISFIETELAQAHHTLKNAMQRDLTGVHMGKQVWGTFSVKDHCDPGAFVAEVMLYDRLVIPIPPDAGERARWDSQHWDPARLDTILEILGDRAFPVKWDASREASWRSRYEAGKSLSKETGKWAFAATRGVLTEGLPGHVTGIQAVANYTSLDDLQGDLGLTPIVPGALHLQMAETVAILGHKFLVPNDPRWTYKELLREAVQLSSERPFRRKRASFWRWQRSFYDDKEVITDTAAVSDAVEEMDDLLEEERALVRKQHIRTGSQFAFLLGSVALGLLGGPLTAVAVGGAFVSVGQFVTDKALEIKSDDVDKPVSLLRDVRKHFGWN